jgi:hypothetical protein
MLKVRKNGVIKGGDIYLDYNPENELLHYSGHIKVGFGPVNKKFEVNDFYHIQKDLMRSDSIFSGKKISEEGVILTVLTVHDDYAVISFDSDDIDGILTVSRKDEYISATSLNAEGKYRGYNIKVDAYLA